LGIIIPTDEYVSEWLKPPTSYRISRINHGIPSWITEAQDLADVVLAVGERSFSSDALARGARRSSLLGSDDGKIVGKYHGKSWEYVKIHGMDFP